MKTHLKHDHLYNNIDIVIKTKPELIVMERGKVSPYISDNCIVLQHDFVIIAISLNYMNKAKIVLH